LGGEVFPFEDVDVEGSATRLIMLIPQCDSSVEEGSKPQTFIPFQMNSDLPHLDAPMMAIPSSTSTGVASFIATDLATELETPVLAAAIELICPGEFNSGVEAAIEALGWYRYFSGTIGTGGVTGTVSKRLNDSLDGLKNAVERMEATAGGAWSDEVDVLVAKDGVEAVDSV
jgi:hypothetical protein